MFTISDSALDILLKFLAAFIRLLAENTSSAFIAGIATVMPASIYMLRKFLGSERDNFRQYVLCPSCSSIYLRDEGFYKDSTGAKSPKRCKYVRFPNHPQCNRRIPCNTPLYIKVKQCNSRVVFQPKYVYAYQPLVTSLQKLLKRPGFSEKLEHWRTRQAPADAYCDVYDGQVWKDFCSEKYDNFLSVKRRYGVMLNVDFFQPFKHTTDSYGVIYLTLMNLPRSERFKKENVMIVGVIPAMEHEPATLNHMLRPLVDELKVFWTTGVRMFTAESPQFKLLVKVALMCVTCDIPAARKCCGFKGHNANLGCSRCLKRFPGGIGNKDFSGFDRTTWPKRTLEHHLEACRRTLQCNTQNAVDAIEVQTGVKYSVLTELEYFDPIRFTVIDPMHNLLLATAKHMMKNVWLEVLIDRNKLKDIEARVHNVTSPNNIGRIPRKISSSFGGFTADQWKNWVILFSMYALHGILPYEHYKCWQAFALSCYFLCRKTVTRVDVQKADLLLNKFCKNVEQLYGKVRVTPNMHLHGHIAECIQDYGSVYGFWCLLYERYNGILGSFPTNKRDVTLQLMRRFIFECECSQQLMPEMFSEYFKTLSPCAQNTLQDPNQLVLPRLPLNCYDLSQVYVPTCGKTVPLALNDYENLKRVYQWLYGENVINDTEMTRSVRIHKNIRICGQPFGSLRCPRTRSSLYIMASWADSAGLINTCVILRPGKVIYYITHKVKIDDTFRMHLFCVMMWYTEHPGIDKYGKPLQIWKEETETVPEGPATFLPIHKISCQYAVAHGRINGESGSDTKVLFVSPLPNLEFH